MRQVQRSPSPDNYVAAHDAAADHAADELRYSAAQAAIAFGIPRIAPIVMSRAAPQAITATVGGAAEVEDLTESLTAAARDAAGVFPEHGGQELPALGVPAAEPALRDPVTASLRIPGRELEERSGWGRAQPHTERLVVPVGPARTSTAVRKSAQRATAVLPHLGRGEAATTTVTLPPDPGKGTSGSPGLARPAQIAKWALVGASAALLLLGVGFLGHALTVANLWPGAAVPAAAPRPPAAYRERLLEQAISALRDGRREQAVGLLLRYQASEPGGRADRTVEIMLRVLKKDLGTPAR